MSDSLPAPLVPADVDLRDFAFMPLDVARLRDSDLASDETPESCWAAVLLWCASWHQVPAASIPDSDQWQAKQCGYLAQGRIAPAWRKVKAGALRGWVKCADGRLYHPVVSEKALDAWRSKLAQRFRSECARIKKHNQRHGTAIQFPEFEAWIVRVCHPGQAQSVPGDSNQLSPGTGIASPQNAPKDETSKGQGQGQGEGQGQGQGQGLVLNTPPDGGCGPASSAEPPTPQRSPSLTAPKPTPQPPFDGRNAEALNGKAVVALAGDWALPEAWGLDAEALGFTRAEVLREEVKFRVHWTAGRGIGTRRNVAGWRSTWTNWLGKAAKDHR